MPRGGYRPNGGRPRKSVAEKAEKLPADVKAAARKSRMSPLNYMLAVMRDPAADVVRRDRMAIAAAPFCHGRVADNRVGKKQIEAAEAKVAGVGTDWANDIVFEGNHPN